MSVVKGAMGPRELMIEQIFEDGSGLSETVVSERRRSPHLEWEFS